MEYMEFHFVMYFSNIEMRLRNLLKILTVILIDMNINNVSVNLEIVKEGMAAV